MVGEADAQAASRSLDVYVSYDTELVEETTKIAYFREIIPQDKTRNIAYHTVLFKKQIRDGKFKFIEMTSFR